MDFKMTPQHLMIQQMARQFAQTEVKPLASEIDEQERYPRENVDRMFELGLFKGHYPKELGGGGGDHIGYTICIEEISKVCASTSSVLSIHASLGIALMVKYGSPEQKAKYLDMLMNREVACFALTEAGAGSDAAGVKTKAVRDGDDWIIDGTKMFISMAGQAGIYYILAISDKEKGAKGGISCFIVEADNPGLIIGKIEKKCGIKGSSTGELILKNCRVPGSALIGREGKGLNMGLEGLDGGRLGIAAQAVGIAQGALDEAMKYVKERKQFGKRISQFQKTQFSIADMNGRIEAARLMVRKTAYLKDINDKEFGFAAASAKLFASDIANEVTRECIQLMGGYGYTREYPVERMFRDAKITEIYEGTSEVQRMVIARKLGIN